MCSRHTLHHPIGMLAQYFQVAGGTAPPAPESFQASYNIAPSHNGIVIVQDGERKFMTMEVGLISPHDDRPNPKRYINARAETVDQLYTFREAFRKRRCLIPMSGFYEPDHITGSNDPYYFYLDGDRPFAAAGIWEVSESPLGKIHSYAIITVPANRRVSTVHDRMPAILDGPAQNLWLDPNNEDTAKLKSALKPYAGDDLQMRRVNRSVYKNLSIGPDCIEPYEAAPEEPNLFSEIA